MWEHGIAETSLSEEESFYSVSPPSCFFGPEEPFSTHSKAFSGELCCLVAYCFQNCFLLFVSNLPLLVSSHFNGIMEKNA